MSFHPASVYPLLYRHFQQRVSLQEPLHRHCALGVGGQADLWVSLNNRQELIDLVSWCACEQWPLLLIGNGSNTLFTESGVRGIVAQANFSQYTITPLDDEQAELIADAGVHWPMLVYELAKQGWSGLEFGIGIPGTLGGALVSNAGAHDGEIGQAVEWIEVLDARGANHESEDSIAPPQLYRYPQEMLDLGYHYSRFRAHHQSFIDHQGDLEQAPRQMIEPAELITRLCFRLKRANPQDLRTRLMHYRRTRRLNEPNHEQRGLIFQNPPGNGTASEWLRKAGLGGLAYGCAQIARENPNYIVNLGNARASEIIWLIEEAHRRVLERFQVDLPLDINLIGETAQEYRRPLVYPRPAASLLLH